MNDEAEQHRPRRTGIGRCQKTRMQSFDLDPGESAVQIRRVILRKLNSLLRTGRHRDSSAGFVRYDDAARAEQGANGRSRLPVPAVSATTRDGQTDKP